MSKITWGIIGCGNVTEKKSGPALSKVPNSKLIAVMRRDAEKAADYARRHNVAKWYDDGEKLMDDAGINSVYVATPPASHLDYTLAALKKGLNVYIEKPVTLNAAEAIVIADAVKQSSGKVSIAHYRRAQPFFLKIKELLDAGLIGDIRTVQIRMWQSRKPALVTHLEANWRVNPALSGGGYFHDLSPHQLDLMLYFFGEPEYYHGHALNQSGVNPCDDHVSGQLIFKSGVVVDGSWCFNVAEEESVDSCEIIGSKGSIRFPFFNAPHTITLRTGNNEELINFAPLEHVQQPLIEKVVNYFNGQGPNPCSIDEAIVLMKIIDAFTLPTLP
ncbi:Gfo/Idh/MocA family protein [Mucilaginibacter sp. UR6-11]|uniref:Gfo/Idh/MocA family protein n=1 Tax=Mucilaginibacter sp. UR6-11 TaxID=1435644 RepID=UPI001E3B7E4D|nr:Gfo/Idh/MocA family oxidoreductase [Mucilaginibacter sp. UR6-11]MCC8425675.1 Gfo/Idh/MocA family oxidoreductase [Mucilaginibacter sp. UR6-11]